MHGNIYVYSFQNHQHFSCYFQPLPIYGYLVMKCSSLIVLKNTEQVKFIQCNWYRHTLSECCVLGSISCHGITFIIDVFVFIKKSERTQLLIFWAYLSLLPFTLWCATFQMSFIEFIFSYSVIYISNWPSNSMHTLNNVHCIIFYKCKAHIWIT